MLISIRHSGNIGDIIYSLPAMRAASRLHGEGIHVILCINQTGQLDRNHPLGNVTLNEKIANMAFPLLASLEFIQKVSIEDHKDTPVDYDFDLFRKLNLHYTGHISRWYFYAYPELTCDLSEPIFINSDPKQMNQIILNRTTRYLGNGWDYLLLREFQDKMCFVGLKEEFQIMKAKLPQLVHLPVDDFLEMAQIIKASQLFIGNQSSPFALAEIMKVPRCLEVCQTAHNVIPTGANGYDFIEPLKLKQFIRQYYGQKEAVKS